MATTATPGVLAPGGSFLLESPRPEDVFTPAELTDDQRLIGQTAEEFVTKEVTPLIPELEEHKEGLMAGLLKKAGEIGLLGGGVPEEYGGTGLDRVSSHRALRKNLFLRVLQRERRRAFGNRHSAHRLFRHRGAEEEISAQTRHRRMAGLVLPLGAAGWLRRAELPHARRALSRRPRVDPQRPEDVDHQRRIRRRLHRVRQGGWREVFLLYRRARLPRVYSRRRGKEDGFARQLHRAHLFRELPRAPRESAARNRPRPYRGLQYSQRRPLYAGRLLPGRLQERTGILRALRQGTHRLRPLHQRFRPDTRQARGDGHSHLRPRIHHLSDVRLDRSRHEICRRGRRARPRTP